MTTADRARMTIRIPDELHKTIQNAAGKKGVSLNALLVEILWKFSKQIQSGDAKKIDW